MSKSVELMATMAGAIRRLISYSKRVRKAPESKASRGPMACRTVLGEKRPHKISITTYAAIDDETALSTVEAEGTNVRLGCLPELCSTRPCLRVGPVLEMSSNWVLHGPVQAGFGGRALGTDFEFKPVKHLAWQEIRNGHAVDKLKHEIREAPRVRF